LVKSVAVLNVASAIRTYEPWRADLTPKAVFFIGIVLLLAGPLIAITPFFTPPANGCPCPEGFPNVSYPLESPGIVVAAVGIVLLAYGGLKNRNVPESPEGSSARRLEIPVVGLSGVGMLILAGLLFGIDLTGPGWSILLYQGMGLCLGTLGAGMFLFAGLTSATGTKSGGLFLTAGLILCGFSLLFTTTLSSDFATRCFPDVGCSPILAQSTVTEMIQLGYLLAVGTFFLALGLMFSLQHRRDSKVGR
jgi:hypothetical protein